MKGPGRTGAPRGRFTFPAAPRRVPEGSPSPRAKKRKTRAPARRAAARPPAAPRARAASRWLGSPDRRGGRGRVRARPARRPRAHEAHPEEGGPRARLGRVRRGRARARRPDRAAGSGPAVVVGIAKGGVFVGGALAAALGADFYPVRIEKRRRDAGALPEPIQELPDLTGKRVLVVDDVASTGATLARARALARKAGAREVRTAVLVARPRGARPDFSAFATDELILFGWDYQLDRGGQRPRRPGGGRRLERLALRRQHGASMKRVVLGTAGHIDHGKTSLVRALTGIDTDRLREEKRRGITIELGFAHLAAAGRHRGGRRGRARARAVRPRDGGGRGRDRPRRPRRRRGRGGDAPDPRAPRHLPPARRPARPRRASRRRTSSPASARTGSPSSSRTSAPRRRGRSSRRARSSRSRPSTREGLDALVAELARLAAEVPERPADGPAFLPIDRAFSMKGLRHRRDRHAPLRPDRRGRRGGAPPAVARRRARSACASVQVHGKADAAGARRAAHRGEPRPASSRPRCAAARRSCSRASSRPRRCSTSSSRSSPSRRGRSRHRAKLLLHVGTAQVSATVALLDRGELAPGGDAPSRSSGSPSRSRRSPGTASSCAGSRRSRGAGGPSRAGACWPSPRRSDAAAGPRCSGSSQALAGADPDARLEAILEAAGPAGLDLPAVVGRTALSPRAVQAALERLGARGGALLFDRDRRAWVAGAVARDLADRLLAAVDAFHRGAPARGRDRARGAARPAPARDGPAPLPAPPRAARRARRAACRGRSRPPQGARRRHERAERARSRRRWRPRSPRAGVAPPRARRPARRPWPASEGGRAGRAEAARRRGARGARLRRALVRRRARWPRSATRLVAFLRERKAITTQEFKDLVGATRKHVIPLAEHFDREKVTLRVGEKRVLRGEAK